MTHSKKLGRWTNLFGKSMPFHEETRHAQDISGLWAKFDGPLGSAKTGFMELVIHDLPGWLEPMWGSDGEFLYLRRPEGVWRIRIPPDIWPNAPVFLALESSSYGGRLGSMTLSSNISEKCGWVSRATALGKPMTPQQMDDQVSIELSSDKKVSADNLGRPLVDVVKGSVDDRLTIFGGDEFDIRPDFERDGDWLFAIDPVNGRRVAYSMHSMPHIQRALDANGLWLRFGGVFLPAFDVQVITANPSVERDLRLNQVRLQ